MQSDGNSFGGDVVSESFNMTLWDEENILDQIYQSVYVHNKDSRRLAFPIFGLKCCLHHCIPC